mmetsp:Transcript_19375/g.16587  ORF Transcript_19375/g.16587 Transcript_19375/m.16587 type:complete len:96 (+) Transcript_19375:677-964(+)|eukprot:CAMPEP_0114579690 /NCGR_PEP_ID=MMETSP0125-20121206/4035_1 /TAXON_ID=485358 ORGANISM="Aristerostoma sp., Strain ATCC 50986" /NCGR_SAMPLE_ID=MMETSP0125 /ASSEMBLY_ACC=CAM_ASM_000245 /LENGTH=95 /DNA_ID=CAMNT_0001770623 /DNA_START=619 /DNA_END=906 /DNA_ORIENTATION=-
MKERLVNEAKVNWEDCDPEFKYGTFVKKRLVKKNVDESVKAKSGEEEVTRRKLYAFSMHMPKFDDKVADFLLEKNFDEASEHVKDIDKAYFVDEE